MRFLVGVFLYSFISTAFAGYSLNTTSSTEGNSFWEVPLLKLSASLDGSIFTLTVGKIDDGNFTSSGTMYFNEGINSDDPDKNLIGTRIVTEEVTASVQVTYDLNGKIASGSSLSFHAWYQGPDDTWATVSGITVYYEEDNQELTVRDIPDLMRKKGWEFAPQLMDYWFAGSGKNYGVTFENVMELSYKVSDKVHNWENRALNNNLISKATEKFLIKELKNTYNGNGGMIIPSGGTFDHITCEASFDKDKCGEKSLAGGSWDTGGNEAKSMHWIIDKKIEDYDVDDEYTAAYGKVALRVVAAGKVDVSDDGIAKIQLSKIGIYARDSYDFVGSQNLGCWVRIEPYVYPICLGFIEEFSARNATFRDYNTSIGRDENHGDFRIFSDPSKRITLTTQEFEYTIKRGDHRKEKKAIKILCEEKNIGC